jgi:hypothetical protein
MRVGQSHHRSREITSNIKNVKGDEWLRNHYIYGLVVASGPHFGQSLLAFLRTDWVVKLHINLMRDSSQGK